MFSARWGTDGLNWAPSSTNSLGLSLRQPILTLSWSCCFLSALWSNSSCFWPGLVGRTRKTLQNPLFSCSVSSAVFWLIRGFSSIPADYFMLDSHFPVNQEPFLWLSGRRSCPGRLCLAIILFQSHKRVSHPVFGEVLMGLSTFHLIFSKAWTSNFCSSAELRRSVCSLRSSFTPCSASAIIPWKGHWSSALVMPVARLGCAHGIPGQGLLPATWLQWKSPSHCSLRVTTTHFCAEGAENIQWIAVNCQKFLWGVNYCLQASRALGPLRL